jgi:hypothetical protein
LASFVISWTANSGYAELLFLLGITVPGGDSFSNFNSLFEKLPTKVLFQGELNVISISDTKTCPQTLIVFCLWRQ